MSIMLRLTTPRNAFKDEALIYIATNGNSDWIKVSQCLWSTATQIRGKIALYDHYSTLEGFFVDFLGVQTLNLQMVFDKLKGQGTGQSSVEEVKETIWALNSFLRSEAEQPHPESILESRIFPGKDPNG